MQFNQKKNIKSDFQFTENMADNAKNIMKIIERLEGEIQASLSVLYEEMPNGFFKNLRRVTPLTKTKMVWNLNAIKMNRNLLGLNKWCRENNLYDDSIVEAVIIDYGEVWWLFFPISSRCS